MVCVFAGLAPTYAVFALLLIPCGFFALTVMTTANSTVQLSTQPEFRGRVMALYTAVFLGGTPLGAPIIGWVGDAFGPRWTLLVGAIACGLTFIAVGWFMVSKRRLRARLNLRWPFRLEVWHKK